MKKMQAQSNPNYNQSKVLWGDYLKHQQQNENAVNVVNEPNPFELKFWKDYELLIKNAQQIVPKPRASMNDDTQKILSIYNRFWKTTPNSIDFVLTQTIKLMNGHGLARIIAAILIFLGFINMEAGQLLVPLGAGILTISFKIKEHSGSTSQTLSEHQTQCSLKMTPTQLTYQQVDQFKNEYTFTMEYDHIIDVQITRRFITIKSLNPHTSDGKIPTPSNPQYSSSFDVTQCKHLVRFLFEVVNYNREQKLLGYSV